MLLWGFPSEAIPGRKREIVYPILQLTVIDDKLVMPYLIFIEEISQHPALHITRTSSHWLKINQGKLPNHFWLLEA